VRSQLNVLIDLVSIGFRLRLTVKYLTGGFMRAASVIFSACIIFGTASSSEGLDPTVLIKVKAATVFIRSRTVRGEMQGSGFFCDKNLIVTNAGVLGMRDPAAFAAKEIKVVLNGGIPDKELVTGGVVAALDPEENLAYIRTALKEGQVPDPLNLSKAQDIAETHPVFILGFPFGEALAEMKGNPAVTVGTGAVSALRLDQSGLLDKLQINGNFSPGNGGGPIVLRNGDVAAISAVSISGAQIGFAIPCDKVRADLSGRITRVKFSDPKKDGQKHSFQIEVAVIDPLERIDSMTLYSWAAEPGAERPIDPVSQIAIFGAPGDQQRNQSALSRAMDGNWRCEIHDALIPNGKEFWYQVGVVTTTSSRERLTAAKRCDAVGPAYLESTPKTGVPAKPVNETGLTGIEETSADGRPYLALDSRAEKLHLPRGLIQLVSAPSGKFIYGIFQGDPVIKVFQPPSFREVEEIPVPHNPVSLWCDESRLVVACDESRVVTIIDALEKTPIYSVKIDRAAHRPQYISGVAADGSLMTVWLDASEKHVPCLYSIDLKGKATYVVSGYNVFSGNWVVPLNDGKHIISQDFGYAPSGPINVVDIEKQRNLHTYQLEKRLFGEHEGFHSDYGHCFHTADKQNLIIPRKNLENKELDWTYVTTPALGRICFNFPGAAIAELPADNTIVSVSGGRNRVPEIFYVNRSTGQVLRKIRVKGLDKNVNMMPTFGPPTPGIIFVPGHEFLISVDGESDANRTVVAVRCGPVKNALTTTGKAARNEPPKSVHAGDTVSFTPDFDILGEQTTFKLKRALEDMKIDPLSGAVSWKSSEKYIGKNEVQILAEVDGQDVSVLTWNIDVEP
jgi:hypothetical protein